MKSGTISVLNSTVPAIASSVVDSTGPTLRLGSVAALALSGAAALATLVIDLQAGKVAVLLDANHAAIKAAVLAADNIGATIDFEASGDAKAKAFTSEGATVINSSIDAIDAAGFTPVVNALMVGAVPALTLSAAISAIEDAMVNVEAPIACLLVIGQASQEVTLATFIADADVVTAYAAAKAASTVQSEFLSTPASATPGQFFE